MLRYHNRIFPEPSLRPDPRADPLVEGLRDCSHASAGEIRKTKPVRIMTLIFISLFPFSFEISTREHYLSLHRREVETFRLPAALYRRLVPSVNVKLIGAQPNIIREVGLLDERPGSDWDRLELESIFQ